MQPDPTLTAPPYYVFNANDPYDRNAPVRPVVARLLGSRVFMRSIRDFSVPADSLAVWFLGQNGFLLKASAGPLIAIDPYLSDSCAHIFAHLPFRLDRQLPVFIEPEDLDVDIVLCTHSHHDHADADTLRRIPRSASTLFLGPWDAQRIFAACGLPPSSCRLLHPGQSLALGAGTSVECTFALPTDNSDLNHTGALFTFPNGIRFFNTGDTAYAPRLGNLLPQAPDICSICINGGFHNLASMQAAEIVTTIAARVAIPAHYDMMVNNAGSPESLRVALHTIGSRTAFHQMRYYEPWLYRPQDFPAP